MIPINILVEDTSDRKEVLCAKGLSILIHTKEQKILFDTGPNSVFIKNAKKFDFNLADVDTLILSHAHRPFIGGVNSFCKINKNAQIVIENFDTDKYFKINGKVKYDITPKFKKKNLSRIRRINNPAQITTNSWFIPCTVDNYGKPKKNNIFFKKTSNMIKKDDFSHEGIFVIDDSGELVIFSSCSHNGVINTIESAKSFFPNKRVRSYVGGMHFPYSEWQEIPPDDMRNLEELIDYAKVHPNLRFFTGHCTGEKAIQFLKKGLGKNSVIHLQAGVSYSV